MDDYVSNRLFGAGRRAGSRKRRHRQPKTILHSCALSGATRIAFYCSLRNQHSNLHIPIRATAGYGIQHRHSRKSFHTVETPALPILLHLTEPSLLYIRACRICIRSHLPQPLLPPDTSLLQRPPKITILYQDGLPHFGLWQQQLPA